MMKISFGNYIKKYLIVFLIIFIIFSCFGFIGVSAMANDIPIQITENEIKQFKDIYIQFKFTCNLDNLKVSKCE